MSFDNVQALAVRTDESAAVDLDFVVLADQAELHGVPEEAAELFEYRFIFDGGTDAAVTLEKVGKDFVCVHGYVAEDVMEDVRLRRVFERLAAAQPGCGGKASGCKHLKESRRRQEAAHRRGIPAGARLQPCAYRGEPGKAVALEADDFKAVEVGARGVLFEFRKYTAHELGPDGVLRVGVGGVVLLNEVRNGNGKRFGFHFVPPLQISACLLLALDGFEERLEVAFAETAAALALNDFEEQGRAIFHGPREDLQHVA